MSQGSGGARRDWRGAIAGAAPIAAAVGLVGASFGALAVGSGVPVGRACAMSLLVFAGGAQFAALGVVAAGGTALAAVASALLLNARYVAFGAALGPRLRGGRLRRLAAMHFLIDESAAMALAEEEPEHADRIYWATGVGIFVCWNLGTLGGAVLGGTLPDPRILGLDAALPAAMLAVLAPLLRGRPTLLSAGIGGTLALGLAPFVPAGIPVLAASLGALAAFGLATEGA